MAPKLIGQGGYGCVYNPHIACASDDEKKETKKTKTKKTNSVGKLLSSRTEADVEKRMHKKIDVFDPHGKFTVQFHGACEVRPKDHAKLMKDCKLTRIRNAKDTVVQLMFENGGAELRSVVSRLPLMSNFYIDDLIPSMLTLYEGLLMMIKKKTIHCDIKPVNILFNIPKHKLTLIDFGLMRSVKRLFKSSFLLEYAYPYYPPEYCYLERFRKLKQIEDIDELRNEMPHNAFLSNFSYYEDDKFFDFMIDMFDKDLEKDNRAFYLKCQQDIHGFEQRFQKKYWETFDCYSLSMSFLEMCRMLHDNDELKTYTRDKKVLTRFLKEVIIPCIEIDADVRMHPKEAIKLIKQLLPIPSPKPIIIKPPSKTIRPISMRPIAPSPLTPTQCMTLKRTELVARLKILGLPTSGTKAKMCERLTGSF